eukprot:TRINITY_DN734_c0_g1_i4.p1 TRINITY_DN734_c0_g1~~TRINITY_DN734_c0_g1_i4.p1  ORF type:complete len:823 (-),score=259.81 TRINITY_DN734_c0_g1_i4:16-2484(-)
MGKKTFRFYYEIGILDIDGLPQTGLTVFVKWKRGSKRQGKTRSHDIADGVVKFNEGFGINATLFEESSARFQKKPITFVVFQDSGRKSKSVASITLNLSDYANFFTQENVTKRFTLSFEKKTIFHMRLWFRSMWLKEGKKDEYPCKAIDPLRIPIDSGAISRSSRGDDSDRYDTATNETHSMGREDSSVEDLEDPSDSSSSAEKKTSKESPLAVPSIQVPSESGDEGSLIDHPESETDLQTSKDESSPALERVARRLSDTDYLSDEHNVVAEGVDSGDESGKSAERSIGKEPVLEGKPSSSIVAGETAIPSPRGASRSAAMFCSTPNADSPDLMDSFAGQRKDTDRRVAQDLDLSTESIHSSSPGKDEERSPDHPGRAWMKPGVHRRSGSLGSPMSLMRANTMQHLPLRSHGTTPAIASRRVVTTLDAEEEGNGSKAPRQSSKKELKRSDTARVMEEQEKAMLNLREKYALHKRKEDEKLLHEEVIFLLKPQYEDGIPVSAAILFRVFEEWQVFGELSERQVATGVEHNGLSGDVKFVNSTIKAIRTMVDSHNGENDIVAYWLSSVATLLHFIHNEYHDDDDDDDDNDELEDMNGSRSDSDSPPKRTGVSTPSKRAPFIRAQTSVSLRGVGAPLDSRKLMSPHVGMNPYWSSRVAMRIGIEGTDGEVGELSPYSKVFRDGRGTLMVSMVNDGETELEDDSFSSLLAQTKKSMKHLLFHIYVVLLRNIYAELSPVLAAAMFDMPSLVFSETFGYRKLGGDVEYRRPATIQGVIETMKDYKELLKKNFVLPQIMGSFFNQLFFFIDSFVFNAVLATKESIKKKS